ncbi:MAG: hypothetical protein DLM57_15320 [Pseudonocardiales bacterium]|nr:MAG: hypothetical protein DLM57_15320 [Pseudonocardiales bacterium]
MTTPPPDGPGTPDPDPGGWAKPVPSEPVSYDPLSLDKPAAPFDPYRYGAPEHPVPAEFAPPGYTPPPVSTPPAAAQPYLQTQPGHHNPANPYPYVAPPPYAQQYPQPRTGNGKAIAALVLGILAIVFFWTSIFDVVLVALGIIFGVLGMSDASRGGGGRGMAISGLVCAVVGALLATVFTVVVYSRIRPCLDNYDRGSSAYNKCVQNHF